jgi:hypothetical protein
MTTGSLAVAQHVFRNVRCQGTAELLANDILGETEEFVKSYRGDVEDLYTTFLVMGISEKSEVDMYEVNVTDIRVPVNGKNKLMAGRGARKLGNPYYAHGSGRQFVGPALQRDSERGFMVLPETPLEAMLLCYSVGVKADSDLYVNDQLQFGCVSPSETRLLLHPDVQGATALDHAQYVPSLLGIPADAWLAMQQMDPVTLERRKQLFVVRESFYRGLMNAFQNLLFCDNQANYVHSLVKVGKKQVDEYKAMLDRRTDAAGQARQFVDAYLSGKLERIVDTLRAHEQWKGGLYDEALKLVQPPAPTVPTQPSTVPAQPPATEIPASPKE